MARFLFSVIPRASRRLREIEGRAAAIPDPQLRHEALESIRKKAYHVQGGSVLATFLSGAAAREYIAIVAPLETIYDYLDNLCDRLAGVAPQAYPTLHEALLDAVDPARPLRDWYRDGPHRDDGGYLHSLVVEVRERLAALPSFEAVRSRLFESASLYAELQTFKHYASGERETACDAWYGRNAGRFPGLHWWEFAAACGSSLPVFAMIYLATRSQLDAREVDATFEAYFPNVSAVHILLDYYIDQAEDREHRELNFVACYTDSTEAIERLRRLLIEALARLRALASPRAHEFLIRAMCLFYLSHPKVFEQRLDLESNALLAALG